MRRTNRIERDGEMVDVPVCRWWRHDWKWWGLGGHTRTCTICGETVRCHQNGEERRPPVGDGSLARPPAKPRGSHFVNTCPDGRGGGVWVDVNCPPIPVVTREQFDANGAAALGVEIERAADALTDDLLASPYSPFRPGTYR